jgi:hypothetical protein
VEIMRFALFAAAALVGCAPSPCPPVVGGIEGERPDETDADADGPKPSADMPSVPAALVAAGHRCETSKDDEAVTVCEPGTPGLVPFVVVESPPMVLFAAYFRHRPAIACRELAPLLNELNAKADDIKVVCDGERVSFVTSFALPSRGFTPDEIVDLARRYQALIQLMLREDALRAALE